MTMAAAPFVRTASRVGTAVALSALLAGPALAQRLGQGEGTEVPVWRVIAALLLCLALAVGAAFALRKRLGGGLPLKAGRPRRLQLVESLRLSHQTDLCLVECDGTNVLIASTPHGVTLIGPQAPRPQPEQQEIDE
jgi:flagellar biogenesis protein FliO